MSYVGNEPSAVVVLPDDIIVGDDLIFTSAGARITGDFSNATIANRLLFQTSTPNATTTVYTIPNGTSTSGGFVANNSSSNPDNASEAYFGVSSSDVIVSSGIRGTGAYLPMTFYTSASEKFRIGADSNGTFTFKGDAPRIQADFSNGTVANRAMFQTNQTNQLSLLGVVPNGTGNTSALQLYNSTDPVNYGWLQSFCTTSAATFGTFNAGSQAALPLAFYTGGIERMRIDAATGNVGIATTPNPNSIPSLQVSDVTLSGNSAGVSGLYLTTGAYFNSGWKGSITGALATKYESTSGVQTFSVSNAPVSVGSPITWSAQMTIDASGNLGIGTAPAAGYRIAAAGPSDGFNYIFQSSSANAPGGVRVLYPATAPNSATSQFLFCDDSAGVKFEVRSNGGIGNYQANDVSFSDERLKKDIQPATKYLDKICAIPVVTYLYKDQTDTELNLGVIAQQVDAIAPELVCHSGLSTDKDKDAPTLAIYSQDFTFAIMKALQELKAEFDAYKAAHP